MDELLKIKKINFIFFLLILVLVIINLFYFNPNFIPTGDTMHNFCASFFFYNEYITQHHLAQWMPNSSYGVPSLFQQVGNLTPARYVVGFIASLFNVSNVLLVWKFSILLEQMIFLLGLYWLTQLLYSRRSTVFFVCLGGIMSVFWWEQIFFELQVFYMLPLMMYFIIMFFKKDRPEYFWVAGLVGVTAVIGLVPYIIGVWLLIFSIVMGTLSFKYWKSWTHIFTLRASNIGLIIFFFCISLIYLYTIKAASYGVNIISTGRDLETGKTLIDNFLTYGGFASPWEVVRAFISGDIRHKIAEQGNLSYIGIFPLIFFLWAVIRVRKRLYYVLLAITIVLIALSFGGSFARILYHFPLMGYFRHLAYLAGLIKVFILLCAGYGWENFFSHLTKRNSIWKIMGFTVLFLGLLLGKFLVFPLWALSLLGVFVFGMIGWGACSRIRRSESIALLMMIFLTVFIIDMGFFQKAIYDQSAIIPKEKQHLLESTKINHLEYRPQRLFSIFKDGRSGLAMEFLNLTEKGTRTYYSWENSFIQQESCIPDFPIQMASPEVGRIHSLNPVLLAVAGGCYEPRLRLFSSSEYISEQEEEHRYVMMNGLLNKIVGKDISRAHEAMVIVQKLLSDNIFIRKEVDVSVPPKMNERLTSDALGQIKVLNYATDEIIAEIEVQNPKGAWLLYAEASHPDWKAWVNGNKTRLFVANGVFKALFLDQGKNHVRLFFDQGITVILRMVLAIFGVISGMVYCFFIIKTCLKKV